MKRVLIVAVSLALFSATAFAQEGTAPDWANKNGAVGLGANTTLGGVNGLEIRTYISPLFGLSATVGMYTGSQTTDPDGDDNNQTDSATEFRFGLYGSYKLAYWQRGHLSVIFGGDIVSLSTSTDYESSAMEDVDASGTDILLGLGMQGEYFPTQYLSLHAEVGLQLDFIGPDEVTGSGGYGNSITNTADNTEYSGITVDISGDLWGAAGFTVWFN